MRYLPIHVDLKDVKIVIIGGGPAAEAKLRSLVKTQAQLVVIAPVISDEIRRWEQSGLLSWVARNFAASDLDGARLVYAATEEDTVNGDIAALAQARGILANAADYKDACSFITPALVDRSPVTISIGTEGASPGLARAIKADLEARLPSTLGRFALHVQKLRAKVKSVMPDLSDRQRLWADILGGKDLPSQLRLSEAALDAAVDTRLAGGDENAGHVALVGAGPGDPDLLTHQARQKLHSADVVVYDRLVSKAVLDFGRREAEYIYVGKIPGGVSTPQSEINDILVAKAKEGLSVVRLKSGDPLIFGRADEEIDALRAAEIPFDVCPGITSASAAAAQIGASLTSRGHNKSVTFMTGHDAKGFAEQDWVTLSKPGARAAVYMGIGAARFIQGRLMIHGAAPHLPITIVENASRPNQVIVESKLSTLPADLAAAGIKGPAILMIGYALKHVRADIKIGGVQ